MSSIKLGRVWILRMALQAARVGRALSIYLSVGLVMAAAVARPATAQTFTVLHVFTGTPDGAFSEAPLVRDANGNLFGTTTSGGGSDGTIFKVDTAGRTSILFNFNIPVSGSPNSAGLLLDAAGNLIGVADGGPGGAGVLYRLSKSGNFEILHSFQGGFNLEAGVPSGGVIMDQAGNLYGATFAGGLGPFPGFGTIYRVDPAGNFTVLYKFQGKADGVNPRGPLVRDAAGNLYGVSSPVDTTSTIKGKAFRLAPNGKIAILHTFTGGRDGSAPQGGLLLDSAGNLFGTTAKGGDAASGTIFEIAKVGGYTRLYSFTGAADGNSPNGGLIQDAAGNIFGTTQLGPGQNALGTAFKLSPAHTLTVLHTFQGGRDGAVPFAGLIRDSGGNLYGTAVKNFLITLVQGGSVYKITP